MSLPIDQVKVVVKASASAVNGVTKLLSGGGIFGAIGLLSDLSALKGVNKDALVAEIKDLDPAERAELLADFKAELVLKDKVLESKIESGGDCLNEAISIGIDAYDLIEQSVTLANKVKELVGAA